MGRLLRYALLPTVAAFAAFFAVAPSGGVERVVEIRPSAAGWRYEPASLAVSEGTRVAFVNRSRRTHTASCDGCPWTTGDIQPGQQKIVTFRRVGRYRFSCRYHPTLTGEITVGSAASPGPDPDPGATGSPESDPRATASPTTSPGSSPAAGSTPAPAAS